jgi:hypothetical protein
MGRRAVLDFRFHFVCLQWSESAEPPGDQYSRPFLYQLPNEQRPFDQRAALVNSGSKLPFAFAETIDDAPAAKPT